MSPSRVGEDWIKNKFVIVLVLFSWLKVQLYRQILIPRKLNNHYTVVWKSLHYVLAVESAHIWTKYCEVIQGKLEGDILKREIQHAVLTHKLAVLTVWQRGKAPNLLHNIQPAYGPRISCVTLYLITGLLPLYVWHMSTCSVD